MFHVALGFLENKSLVNAKTLYNTNLFTHKTQNLIKCLLTSIVWKQNR